MEVVYITDSSNDYRKSSVKSKLLVGEDSFRFIKEASFLNPVEIGKVNEKFTYEVLLKGDDILNELKLRSETISNVNFRFCNQKNNKELALTHLLFRRLVEKKFFLMQLLETLSSLVEVRTFELHLSEDYCLFDFTSLERVKINVSRYQDKRTLKKVRLQKLKNWLYLIKRFKRKVTPRVKAKKRIVFVVQTAEHHHQLLKTLYQKLHLSDSYELVVVAYSIGIGDRYSYRRHLPKGVKVYEIEDFLDNPRERISRKLFNRKGTSFPESIYLFPELNYAKFQSMVEYLKPCVCITVGYMDTGRYLSDVCRSYNIPTISIDYSGIADDYTFEKYIEYDHRAVISESQKNTWIRRNDPTLNHHVVGFLKYDEELSFNKHFHLKNKLREDSTTILFASSHGIDPGAKEQVLRELSILCAQRKFNLIVKKHPLETDEIANEIISKESQVVLGHSDTTTIECIHHSDIVISLGSSIVLDAIKELKPHITLALNTSLVMTDFMPIAEEPFIFKVDSVEKLSPLLDQLSNVSTKEKLQDEMLQAREKYLYQIDKQASHRVFHIIQKIAR